MNRVKIGGYILTFSDQIVTTVKAVLADILVVC
jgi:hypothetical protein